MVRGGGGVQACRGVGGREVGGLELCSITWALFGNLLQINTQCTKLVWDNNCVSKI